MINMQKFTHIWYALTAVALFLFGIVQIAMTGENVFEIFSVLVISVLWPIVLAIAALAALFGVESAIKTASIGIPAVVGTGVISAIIYSIRNQKIQAEKSAIEKEKARQQQEQEQKEQRQAEEQRKRIQGLDKKYNKTINCPYCKGTGTVYAASVHRDAVIQKYRNGDVELISPESWTILGFDKDIDKNECWTWLQQSAYVGEGVELETTDYRDCPFCRGKKIAYAWFEKTAPQKEIVHIKTLSGGSHQDRDESKGNSIMSMPYLTHAGWNDPIRFYMEVNEDNRQFLKARSIS